MKSNLLRLSIILLLTASFPGCASILTASGPVKFELVDGKRTVGDFSQNEYRIKIRSNKLFVQKTPLCTETVEKIRIEQKRLRGWSFAIGELVFFGYGFIDLASAAAISEDSRKEYKVADYETSRRLTCGDLQTAPGEIIIIEDKKKNVYRKAYTNKNGALDLKKVLGDPKEPLNLKIHLASDKSLVFSYLYSAD